MGKSTINGPFSMAMLNNQRVYLRVNTVKKPMGFPKISQKRTTKRELEKGDEFLRFTTWALAAWLNGSLGPLTF